MKELLFQEIDKMNKELTDLADDIFDHPEVGCQEFRASAALERLLEENGFRVEKASAAWKLHSGQFMKIRLAGQGSDFYVNTMPLKESDMPAATIPRDRLF